MSACAVDNLVRDYGSLRALDRISFEVRKGEIFGLIGPNGSGKTTTLRIVATLLKPTQGSVRVFDLDVARKPAEVRHLISYLPEEAGAYKNLSGDGYLKFMADLYAPVRKERDEVLALGQEISGLGTRLRDKVKTYSKGMTRRLLLARALMTKPRLAILDEPTSGLDVANAMEVRKRVREFAKAGTSVLLSSHNMLEVEFLSDRVALVSQGRVVETGTPAELKERHSARNLEEVFMAVAG